jgi:hypothetical protein
MRVYGHDLSADQLRARVGRMEQLASSTLVVEEEGPARGMRRLVVRCGELAFDVHPDRAMDIGAMSFRGIPLAWTSPAGVRSPAGRGGAPMSWLETFSGGLIATCGLDAFGSPSEVDGEQFPLHGRIGTQQAVEVNQETSWTQHGTFAIQLSGRVRQARLFGEALELHRVISCELGSARITVQDTVTNLAATEQPHMLLYHINLGWPLVDDTATLAVPSEEVIPRDADARAGVDRWDTFEPPSLPRPEQVFGHRIPAGTEVAATVRNQSLGIALDVGFHSGQLPHMFQWKLLASGSYVLGLEPANCPVIEGRATAAERDLLPVLAPGESRRYDLSFTVRDA